MHELLLQVGMENLLIQTPKIPRFIGNLLRVFLPLAAIDIDVAASKGKGKAIVTTPEENDFNNREASASLAKIVFILKLLTTIPLMYSSSIDVLLRKDAEVSGCRAPLKRAPTVYCITGIFLHILHRFLPYSRSSKKEKKN
eukprot:XP_019077964.1 PREDICTED: E3 ubiquitin-protein ligase UPL2-like [Vitis vinifera]